ncbi:hypothetical protein WJX77_006340 [Trebouxia sp. C0004]
MAMGVPMADTDYIKRMVGDTLAKGCAATVAANPTDPVEYLGQWLLQQAKVRDVQDQIQQQQKLASQAEEAEQASAAAALETLQLQQSKQQEALSNVASCTSDLWELWQKAVAVCTAEAKVGGAYIAVVTEPAAPLPEVAEAEEETELADEAPIAPPAVVANGEAGGEGAAEGEAAPEASPAAAEEGEEGEGEEGPPKPDYSKNSLEYVITSSGQEWMLERSAALTRPPPPGEDAGEDAPVRPAAPTFRLLDEALPNMYLPNVAYTRSMVFFKQFPRVGAYWACGLKGSGERVEAILAADSLMPPGNGRPLSHQDREFVEKLAAIVGANMAELGRQRAASAAAGAGKAAVYDLEKKLAELEAGTVLEPYTGEDLKESLKAVEAALSKANSKLAAIQEVVKSAAGSGVSELMALPCAPPLTWNVLKAMLLVMGKNPHNMDTWLKCRAVITVALFEEASRLQGPLPTGQAVWREVRGCMVAAAGGRKALVDECPASCIGALVAMLLQQVRRTDKAAEEAAKAKKAVNDADAAAAAAAAEAARAEEEAKAAAAAQQAEEAAAAAAQQAEEAAAAAAQQAEEAAAASEQAEEAAAATDEHAADP